MNVIGILARQGETVPKSNILPGSRPSLSKTRRLQSPAPRASGLLLCHPLRSRISPVLDASVARDLPNPSLLGHLAVTVWRVQIFFPIRQILLLFRPPCPVHINSKSEQFAQDVSGIKHAMFRLQSTSVSFSSIWVVTVLSIFT